MMFYLVNFYIFLGILKCVKFIYYANSSFLNSIRLIISSIIKVLFNKIFKFRTSELSLKILLYWELSVLVFNCPSCVLVQ
jgi:hypothetical protein